MDSRIVVASVALALSFVAQANTVAWWHLDDLAVGTKADGSAQFKNAIDPSKHVGYARSVYSAVLKEDAVYYPSGAASFPSYWDFTVGTQTENTLCALFRPVNSNTRNNGGVIVIDSDSLIAPQSFTLETFYKVDLRMVSTIYQFILCKECVDDPVAPKSGFRIQTSNGSTQALLHYRYLDGNGALASKSVTIGKEIKPDNGRWHHLALTYDASTKTVRFYLDYALAGSSTQSIPFDIDSANPYLIGASGGATYGTFDGFIDEFRISDKALLPAEFLRVTTEGLPQMFPETVVYQRFTPFPDWFGPTNAVSGWHPLMMNEAWSAKSLGRPNVIDAGNGSGYLAFSEVPVDNVSTGGIGSARAPNRSAVALRSTEASRAYIANANVPSLRKACPCWTFDGANTVLSNSDFTAEMFIRTTNVQYSTYIFTQLPRWHLDVMGNGGELKLNDNGLVSSPRIADGKWHHVALVVDYNETTPTNSLASVYLDYRCVYSGMKSNEANYTNALEAKFGVGCYGKSEYVTFFDVDFDDVRVTARKLSVGEFLHPSREDIVCDLTFEPDELNFGKAWDPQITYVDVQQTPIESWKKNVTDERPSATIGDGLFAEQEANVASARFQRALEADTGKYACGGGAFQVADPDYVIPSGNFTAELEFKFPENDYTNWPSGATPYIFYQKSAWLVYISGAGLTFDCNGWTIIHTVQSASRMCDGRWHHVAYVYDKEHLPKPEVRLYFDRQLVASKTVTLNTTAPDKPDIYIGEGEWTTTHGVPKWWVDNIRIVRKALKPSEFKTSKHVGEGDTLVWAPLDRTGDVESAMDETPTFSGTAWAAGAGQLVDKDEQPIAGRGRNKGALAGGGAYSRLSLVEIPDFTAEFFVKDANKAASGTDLVGLMGADGTTPIWSVRKGADGNLHVFVTPQGGTLTDLGSFGAAAAGWTHVAVVFDPAADASKTAVRVYVGYDLVGSETFFDGTLAVQGLSTSALTFGSFGGAIDELRIVKGTLSADDMLRALRLGFAFFLK